MRKALLAAFIAIFTVLTAQASEVVSIESKLEQIRAEIEVQMERMQWAQETVEARMSVADARVEEQLRIAEEDLAAQVEKLEMLRDQLKDQIREAERAIESIRQDWKVTMVEMYERIRSQIGDANDLLRRLRQLRSKSNAVADQASLLPAFSDAAGNGADQLNGANPCPGAAPLSNESPTVTVNTPVEPALTLQVAPDPVALLPPTPTPTPG